MRTVLIIGSDFCPSGLPPATRIRFFATHLQEYGWKPIVLTTHPEFYEWEVDPENTQLLPETVEVIRTNALPVRWTRRIGIGDIGIRTLWHHWQAIKRICRERRIDLIFIPVPPYVPMILGRLAHKRFGIPYVIDYIDPWITEAYKRVPRSERPPKWILADALSRTVEPFALKYVALITGVSKGTTESVIQRYSWLSSDRATEIPYGAERGDFEHLRRRPRAQSVFDRHDKLVHVSYVGACIPGMHATVRAIFAAQQLGLQREPERFKRIRFHFVGTSYAANGQASRDVLRLAREFGIEDYVDEQPARIPYLESLQVMLDSDALLLLGSNETHYTASKVFPCILAQRPLLAVFHEASSVIEVLKQTGAGESITFNASSPPHEKILEFNKVLARFAKSDPVLPKTNWDALEQYSTTAMSARLALCLNKALAHSEIHA